MNKLKRNYLSKFVSATMIMLSLTTTSTVYARTTTNINRNTTSVSQANSNSLINANEIKTSIYNAVNNIQNSVVLKIKASNVYDQNTFNYFCNTNIFPKIQSTLTELRKDENLFYLNTFGSYSLNLKYDQNEPYIEVNLPIQYLADRATVLQQKAALNAKADEIIRNYIKSNMSNLEKEMAIHDYIVLNTKYDKENLDLNRVPDIDHTAYQVLVNHTGVCDGYSKAFKLLLSKVGINSIIVTSQQIHHAWNIVTLNGKNYQVDTTWDDPTPDREGKTRYKYFNLDDATMKQGPNPHIWNENEYPRCTSADYLYLSNMDNVIKKDNTIYYVDNNSNLFKMNIDGSEKQSLTNNRVESFAIAGDYIYYTNYSNGAYIYKIKIDGSNDTLFSTIAAKDLLIKDEKIIYTNYYNNQKEYLNLPKAEEIKNGWINENNTKVYYRNNLKLIGWQAIAGKTYFLNNNGSIVTGQKKIGSRTYLFNNDGSLIREVIVNTPNAPSSTVLKTGWITVNGVSHYIKQDGSMATGWLHNNDHWYYLNSKGAKVTGWLNKDGMHYYLNNDGALVNIYRN